MKRRSVATLLLLVAVALIVAYFLRPPLEVVRYDDLVWKNDVYFHANKPFTGVALATHEDGKPKGEYPFTDGRFHGLVREWWETGVQAVETHFEKGQRHGKNTYWDQNGRLTKEQVYDHDRSVSVQHYSPDE